MIDVKEAAKSAIKYFTDIYGENIRGIAVEEVEMSDDEHYWYITIGYIDESKSTGFLQPFAQNRAYKIFEIDANDGTVKSMKIRDVSEE